MVFGERVERSCCLVERDGDEPARPVALGELYQFISLPAGDRGEAWSGESP